MWRVWVCVGGVGVCRVSKWCNDGRQAMKGGLCFIFQAVRKNRRKEKRDVWKGEAAAREGGRRWMSNIWVLRERRGKKEGTPRLQVWCGRFSDSYNSPAYRISSTQVVLKLCRRAAALSSPKLWQVDLLVLKFVQIRRHSWQTVKVSVLQCSCRGPFAFPRHFCRDRRFFTTRSNSKHYRCVSQNTEEQNSYPT